MKLFRYFAVAVASLLLSAAAIAQTYGNPGYPYSNPTYVPTAVAAPVTFTAAGDYDFAAHNVGTAIVTVKNLSGTLVASVRGSNDALSIADASATWTVLPVQPTGGGAITTSITANGTWTVQTAGFTRVQVHITTLTSGSHTVTVQMSGTPATSLTRLIPQDPAQGDPCQNPYVAKSSAVINVGAATTTKIVDTSGTTTIYVCGFVGSLAGTTPSVTFKTGTHGSADCDTSAATLSGTILPTSGSMISFSGAGSFFKSIAGGQICATTAGTGSSFQGVMSYVQQ